MMSDFSLPDTHSLIAEILSSKVNSAEQRKFLTNFIKSTNFPALSDFPKGLEWFNVSEPLSLAKNLKGKIVILDFFTYCCINCMHVLPDLKEIEEKYSIEDGLVVVGVHSAKFENEKLSANILSAVQRYNISHPVVNDADATMWNKCEINCWPTLLVVGPDSNPLLMLMGEGHKETLSCFIETALIHYKSIDKISQHSLPIRSAFRLLPDLKGPLLFPGKVAVFRNSDELEIIGISDTGNHRILLLEENGRIVQQVGGRSQGFRDGNLEEAEFNSPQGLVFLGADTLFVADTENHAIRKINLLTNRVETVAGTGKQGSDYVGGKKGIDQEISSPWDLAVYRTSDLDMTFHAPNEVVEQKDVLLIAMAGTHQVWALFLQETIWWKYKKYPANTCVCIAGSGREENRNNAYPHAAAFAQPSGIAVAKGIKEAFVADSESSTIRRLSLQDGKVTGVVGGDRSPDNLFAFGDKDGTLLDAKLQHPLGVAISPDEQWLLVADTYNHKIKKIDLSTNTAVTLVCKDVKWNEPGGLCFSSDGKTLYVADTNNHCVRTFDFQRPLTCRLLALSTAVQSPTERDSKDSFAVSKKYSFGKSGGKLVLRFSFDFMDGIEMTEGAPQKWSIRFPNEAWSSVPMSGFCTPEGFDVVVSVPPATGRDLVQSFAVDFALVVCKNDLCLPFKCKGQFVVSCGNASATMVEDGVVVPICL